MTREPRRALVRAGFTDPEAASDALRRARGARRPAARGAGPHRRPRPGPGRPGCGWPSQCEDRDGAAGRRSPTTRAPSMRLLSVLGASAALADHLVRHPEQWRELTDPTLGLDPGPGVRRTGRAAGGGGRRPGRSRAGRHGARRRGARRAARGVPAGAAAARRPRPRPRPGRRRHRRRAVGPGRRHARGRARRSPARGSARTARRRGWRSSRWASAAATSSTTSPTST